MNTNGPFLINDRTYTEKELMAYASEKTGSCIEGSWEYVLYSFILDFLDEKVSLYQKTSGTTGDPKTIELNREAMISSAQMTISRFNLKAGNAVLLCLPVEYIAGKMMVVRALAGGLNLITVEPSGDPLGKISRKIQFTAMVPLQLYETLKNVSALDNIEKLLIGGGEINHSLMEKVRRLDRIEVYESFAMTETYSHFAVRKLNGISPETRFKPLMGVQIETDNRGCLVVEVPGVTPGRIISNDLVKITGNKEFEWLGRIDNVIKSGSVKIIPEILEKKISKIVGREALIIGIPDDKLGDKIILVMEGSKLDMPLKIWMEKIKGVLMKHEVPKEIIAVSEFPRNKSMKVDREKVKNLIN